MATSSESTHAPSGFSSTSESSSDAGPSILDRLKAPQQSDLTRKRSIDSNPPKGKHRARGEGLCEPKSVSALQRIREFPGEHLVVSNKKLFCKACREELSLKKTVIANHVQSGKHQVGKSKVLSRAAKEGDIGDALLTADKHSHPVGETLPIDQRVYRVKVVKTFLRAAVPLTKLGIFRDLLEEHAFRLSDR